MADTLHERLDRIYAALGATRTDDLSRVKPTMRLGGGVRELKVDFTKAYSKAEVQNMLTLLIANVASMKDHACRAFKDAGIDPDEADAMANEESNAIIRDLHDLDKHGGKSRSGGHSGRSPELRNQVSFLRTSGAGVAIGPELRKVGDGSAQIAVDADVFDGDGRRIGELTSLCSDAITVWEDGLARLGFGIPTRTE